MTKIMTKNKRKKKSRPKQKKKRMGSEGNRAVMEMIILVNSIGDVK